MEINNLPSHSAITPLRATTAVDDGDAGPNSSYYRQQQKKQKDAQKEKSSERSPRLDSSTPHIDIRV